MLQLPCYTSMIPVFAQISSLLLLQFSIITILSAIPTRLDYKNDDGYSIRLNEYTYGKCIYCYNLCFITSSRP